MASGMAPKETNHDSIATVFQDVTVDESSRKSKSIRQISLKSLKRPLSSFCTVTLSGQRRVRNVMYDALEHVIIDQIRMVMLGERIYKHRDRYLEACKTAKK